MLRKRGQEIVQRRAQRRLISSKLLMQCQWRDLMVIPNNVFWRLHRIRFSEHGLQLSLELSLFAMPIRMKLRQRDFHWLTCWLMLTHIRSYWFSASAERPRETKSNPFRHIQIGRKQLRVTGWSGTVDVLLRDKLHRIVAQLKENLFLLRQLIYRKLAWNWWICCVR